MSDKPISVQAWIRKETTRSGVIRQHHRRIATNLRACPVAGGGQRLVESSCGSCHARPNCGERSLEVLMRRTVAAVCVLGCLLRVPGAFAVDVKSNLAYFSLREMPYLPYANVGSNCDVWQSNSPKHGRLYVRSPKVRGRPGLGRQKVGWRARF